MKKSVMKTAEQISKNFDFDIVLGFFTVTGGWLAANIAKKYNKPLAVVGLGSDIHLFHKYFILSGMTLRTLKQANMVIVNAENLCDKAIELGVESEKLKVLPFGFDEKVFNINLRSSHNHDIPQILMVANLVEVKRPHTFIDAGLLLLESGFKAQFLIAGDGYMRKELEEKVRISQFPENFTFYGSIEQDKLAELYTEASCTVLTSRSEGLPFCLIESLACGTPVVSTGLPGVKEIVKDGKNGILTPVDAPRETAEAIREICLWKKSKKEIAESVKERTWKKHALQFNHLLEGILKE
jgi:glycosyltransferase involved in cell wall biosynthesis